MSLYSGLYQERVSREILLSHWIMTTTSGNRRVTYNMIQTVLSLKE